MRNTVYALVGVVAIAGGAAVAAAQQPDMVKTHIGHVMTGFQATPNQLGLLATAQGEAKVAVQHAGLAARTPRTSLP